MNKYLVVEQPDAKYLVKKLKLIGYLVLRYFKRLIPGTK